MSSRQNGEKVVCMVQALECRQEGAMTAAVNKGLKVAVTPKASQKLVSVGYLRPAQ